MASWIVGWIVEAWDEALIGMRRAWKLWLKPTLEDLAEKAIWLWKNVLKPTFQVIKSEWERMMVGMEWVWDHILKPVFDFIADNALPELERSFDNTVKGIKDIWNTLENASCGKHSALFFRVPIR